MSTTSLDLAIVGAGPAGLHAARLASRRGATYTVFDDHARIGDPWRERYRSLRLFTPRRWASLPGMRIDIGFFDYPTGAQLADYLEKYAAAFDLPVRTSTRVDRLTPDASGGFHLDLSTGEEAIADRVIVAAGAHHRPIVPRFAGELDAGIRQLHSTVYQGPEDLAPGLVLVVGAGNSGTDIALDAIKAGHPTVIAGRNPGEVPAPIDTPIGNLMASIFIRRLRNTTIDTERGRRFRDEHAGHGVNLVRNHMAQLEKAGVRHVGRVAGAVDGWPVLDDGEPVDAATVIWCTGSLPRLDWVDIPAAFDSHGWPSHERGMATAVPGLAFMGLPFQYSVASPTLMGMGRDAEYVVEHLFAGDRVSAVVRR
ncbi:flavin-containing monooxygenase [Microbacterium sp. ASV49]|uniref:NAD(P)/FAD-dependent oxidoreductase n=1 Tax=Microbacterium candidum TaxID=3041922 RepID=A0ABT7MUH1_9MICO|nr:NAD(P)/FAD-dependent oxidoreductase [Microbacterium sp. ASV49]MDL9978097.1 NAD(P)/FAD-dependent oxidoreductase [Microbacterium sp. ASV49]